MTPFLFFSEGFQSWMLMRCKVSLKLFDEGGEGLFAQIPSVLSKSVQMLCKSYLFLKYDRLMFKSRVSRVTVVTVYREENATLRWGSCKIPKFKDIE